MTAIAEQGRQTTIPREYGITPPQKRKEAALIESTGKPSARIISTHGGLISDHTVTTEHKDGSHMLLVGNEPITGLLTDGEALRVAAEKQGRRLGTIRTVFVAPLVDAQTGQKSGLSLKTSRGFLRHRVTLERDEQGTLPQRTEIAQITVFGRLSSKRVLREARERITVKNDEPGFAKK